MAYFVPLLILLVKKLWAQTTFLLFALYWGMAGVINLLDFIPGVSKGFLSSLGALYNMLDIPILLTIFYLTSTSVKIRQFAKYAVISYILVEAINAYFKGINYDAIKYVLGLGVFLVLLIVVWEIVCYLRKMEHTEREKAMIFIYAALLFEYGTYIIIYIFDYFIKVSDSTDNLLLYYISSLVAISIASCGFATRQNSNRFNRYYPY